MVYVVREAPIINDATYEDAVQAGIDSIATIISSGTDAPGTILETCSAEFKKMYQNSNFIISKGQGNYEALSYEIGPIFFLLKVIINFRRHLKRRNFSSAYPFFPNKNARRLPRSILKPSTPHGNGYLQA